MGSLGRDESPFQTISTIELHPTFAAEVRGVDFSNLSDETLSEIRAALAKYGVCIFRQTGLDDKSHVAFSRRLGELDDVKRYMTGGRKPRYEYYELFDAGNVDDQGNGNALFHVDSSFNPRRASYSLLRAVTIPPPGNGGNTDFADSRAAFDELPQDLKAELLENDYVGAHTIAHSRKMGSPVFFKDLDPSQDKMALHRLIQVHEPSGRMNLYIAAHTHHIEGVSPEKSKDLLEKLMAQITQKKFVTSMAWKNPGDLVIWDNRCTLHRANGGSFEGRYIRDLRRTTVHDDSSTAWGLNRVEGEEGSMEAYVSSVNSAANVRVTVEVQ